MAIRISGLGPAVCTPKSRCHIAASSWLVFLLLTLSCEIEDDFGKPDNSSYLGPQLYSTQNNLYKIIWSEQPNQLLALNGGIAIINVATKQSTQLSVTDFAYNGNDYVRIFGDLLYYINYDAQLSSVDITNGLQAKLIADSIAYNNGFPISSKYFAFNNWEKYDPAGQPYLFLYDVDTRKETLITSGIPITFSPDGQKLLFSKQDPNSARIFYTYSVQTQTIASLEMIDPSRISNETIKWTSEGVLFYYQNYNGKTEVFNGTNNTKLGEWENSGVPIYGSISPTGNKMITFMEKCASSTTQSYCTSFFKQHYYVLDIKQNKAVEIVYGMNLYPTQFAFSPDESSVALLINNSIFLVRLTE